MSQQHPAGAPEEPTGRDERPRPQFGEYAPEGWTWQPPPGEHTSDPAPQMATPPARPAGGAAAASALDGRPERRGDRIATIALLVIGLFGAIYNALLLNMLPSVASETFRQTAEILGTELPARDFAPGPQVPTLILVGTIVQLALWVIALAWSVRRLRARRLAFWVPLVAGIVAFAVFYVLMAQILLSDPEYARVLMGPGA